MIDVFKSLLSLAKKRPVFHSEADFQHAFAWEIHRQWPAASIRLEMPYQTHKHLFYIDIWIVYRAQILAVELKYKTRSLFIDINNEKYRLKSQRAHDTGRYDFLKDVYRLEQIKKQYQKYTGYAILLTNDSAYWTKPKNKTFDSAFRIHEGRVVNGILSWDKKASDGTKKNREQPIVIEGTYQLHWEDYSRLSDDRHGKFRSLVVKVQ